MLMELMKYEGRTLYSEVIVVAKLRDSSVKLEKQAVRGDLKTAMRTAPTPLLKGEITKLLAKSVFFFNQYIYLTYLFLIPALTFRNAPLDSTKKSVKFHLIIGLVLFRIDHPLAKHVLMTMKTYFFPKNLQEDWK